MKRKFRQYFILLRDVIVEIMFLRLRQDLLQVCYNFYIKYARYEFSSTSEN